MKTRRALLFIFLLTLGTALAQSHKWQEVVILSGYGNYESDLIPIMGTEWKFQYTTLKRTHEPLKIHLYSEDGKYVKQLFFSQTAQAPVSATGELESSLKKGYLIIQGSNSGWTLTFSQYVDDVTGWKLFKAVKDAQKPRKFKKIAMLAGDDGDEHEINISITSNAWRLRTESMSKGRLLIEIFDSNSKKLFHAYNIDSTETCNWFHSKGNYTIKVSSIGTPWNAIVEYELNSNGTVK